MDPFSGSYESAGCERPVPSGRETHVSTDRTGTAAPHDG